MVVNVLNFSAFEAWAQSHPYVILVNSEKISAPAVADLPSNILDRLDGRRPDFLGCSIGELASLGIVLAHDQFAAFLAGRPVLLIADRVMMRAPLARGRRKKDALEQSVQEALAVQVFVVVERLCEWTAALHGRRQSRTVPALRGQIFRQLANSAWVDADDGAKVESDERRLSFFRTCFDQGGRLIAEWYPGTEEPGNLSQVARDIARASAQKMTREQVASEIDSELARIRFLFRCYRQATTVTKAVQEGSQRLRDGAPMTKGQLANLAGASVDRPALFEACRAAIDGDFNPSDLFRNLLSYSALLGMAQKLGRFGRGFEIELDQQDVAVLWRQIEIRTNFDGGHHRLQEGITDEEASALLVTNAAYEMVPAGKWLGVLKGASQNGNGVTLSRRSPCSRG